MSTHDDLAARRRQVLPGWPALYYEHPIALVDGEGCRVRDAEGREYLDFGRLLTTMTGHWVPAVAEAIRKQAERIAGLVPIPEAKVFFTTSGTDSIEQVGGPGTGPERGSPHPTGRAHLPTAGR